MAHFSWFLCVEVPLEFLQERNKRNQSHIACGQNYKRKRMINQYGVRCLLPLANYYRTYPRA